MSFGLALGMTVLRSIVIAILAVAIGSRVNARISETAGRHRRVLWGLLLAPWFMPGLVIGYAWNGWPLYLSAAGIWEWFSVGGKFVVGGLRRFDGLWNEWMLGCLLLARTLPWAVIVLRWGGRSPESRSAWFLRTTLRSSRLTGWAHRWRCVRDRVAWDLPRLAPPLALSYLACFQEFELVARLGRPSWTVWLIDAQATGVELAGLLQRAGIAAVVQTVCVWGPFWISRRGFGTLCTDIMPRLSGFSRLLVTFILVTGFLFTVVIPGLLLLPGAGQGLLALSGRTSVWLGLLRGVAVGTLVAGGAACLSMFVAGWLGRSLWGETRASIHGKFSAGARRPAGVGAGGVFSLVLVWLGACGAVPLGLITVWGLVQVGWGDLLQTIVPWLLIQAVWLVPRAICLLSLVEIGRPRNAAHLATLLQRASDNARSRGGFELWWRLRWRNRAWAGVFLAMTAYLDLATGQLLSPPGLESAPVTLYTQMHYGRNSLLTAMTLLAVAIPWTISLLVLLALPRMLVRLRRVRLPGASGLSR